MSAVTLIDTSILCEMLQVPTKSDPARLPEVMAEMDRRAGAGERFVIPVTALIETGNHIAQSPGDRYTLANKLVALIRAALDGYAPWLILERRIDRGFLEQLCAGDSTGQTLAELAAARVGTGDISLLVERDQLLATTAITSATVWTLDAGLLAVSS